MQCILEKEHQPQVVSSMLDFTCRKEVITAKKASKGDVLPIFSHPISSCLTQLGRQKSLNVGFPVSGQSGLSLLLSRSETKSSQGCLGPAGKGGK